VADQATVTQQAQQAALVSLLADPLANAFQLLTPSEPSTMERFIAAITALIHHFGLASGSVAARYYEAERKAAGVPGSFTVRIAPTADPAKIDTSVRWATKDLWTPTPDLQSAQTLVTGVTEKNVLDVGRETIVNAVQSDRQAKGWARETEPGCCSFCAMLAVRGAVYRSEHSADFQSHDHCRCFAQPVFTSYEPSAQVREWQTLYRDSTAGVHGPKAQRNAFRQAFDAQQPQQ
jgi:hypothetical protein